MIDPADPRGDGADEVYDRVELAYNRTGNLIQRKDQREVVRQFEYDSLGRLLHDRVTDLGRGGENVDGAVRRITRDYNARGILAGIASFDHHDPMLGNFKNSVVFTYGDLGELAGEQPMRSDFSNVTITYPDGRELSYNYGSSGSIDDRLGRVAAIEDDDSTVLAAYAYLGWHQVVTIDFDEADVRLDHAASGYAALDRFGRIVEQRWENYDTTSDLVHHAHAYDRASNRLYREDVVAAGSAGGHHDELYDHDQLHRLTDVQRGELNGAKDTITSLDFQQAWLLDGLGNWAGFDEDLDGSGWDLEQTRAHSDVNEITSTTETTGSAWAGTDHDAAGNMIEMPRADEPTDGVEAVYDAWNRLVELIDEGTQDTLAVYEWDGLSRRIAVEVYDEGDPDETRYYYYTQQHQIIEVRVDGTSASDLAEQYVWGLRYADELILRDRDTTDNAELDERRYALQDANFNVVAIVDDEGAVVERYRYTPYGRRTALNANFTVHADPVAGSHAFAIGHQGLHHDGEMSAGFVYNRARMLHAALGRFVQRDPLNQNEPRGGYHDGANLYQYVYSSPVTGSDPTGKCTVRFTCSLTSSSRDGCSRNCEYICIERSRSINVGGMDCEDLPSPPLVKRTSRQQSSWLCIATGGRLGCPAECKDEINSTSVFRDWGMIDDIQDCSAANCRAGCAAARDIALAACEFSPRPNACKAAAQVAYVTCVDACNALCKN